jgi:hypothetical protein
VLVLVVTVLAVVFAATTTATTTTTTTAAPSTGNELGFVIREVTGEHLLQFFLQVTTSGGGSGFGSRRCGSFSSGGGCGGSGRAGMLVLVVTVLAVVVLVATTTTATTPSASNELRFVIREVTGEHLLLQVTTASRVDVNSSRGSDRDINRNGRLGVLPGPSGVRQGGGNTDGKSGENDSGGVNHYEC